MPTIHGFQLVREQDIPELNTHARIFRHVKTGAELLSLENDDENKCFGVTFRTPPSDSTGVAHIIEHTVLAGSRKYQVKEPFVELIKGSLKTFVNAFTSSDWTTYPVASQNLQDFYNLIDVYLDAVFYPLLNEHTFHQEGWHYELEDAGDPLTYKGVVFNEMKGNYASPDGMLMHWSQRSLFPGHVYGLDYGGDPRHIPDLSYAQFKNFHRRFYHPANTRLFFYGDDPADERLRLLDAWLSDFDPLVVDSAIPLFPPFEHPIRLEKTSIAGDDAKPAVTLNWVLDEAADPETALGLQILAHILLGAPSSPLRKALLDSGLGEDVAGVGLDAEIRQMYFSTGLKGIALEDADKVEALIWDTLQRLATEGIEQRTVEASMNTIEFRLRENNTGGFPRGLALMLRSLGTWLYDGDPLALLAFEAPLNSVKKRLEAGEPYFETLIQRYFLNNPHRSTLILRPDTDLQARWDAEEAARLAAIKATMSSDEIDAVIAETLELRRLQETPDDPAALAAIPRLTLDDLDPENKIIPIETVSVAGSQMVYHDLFTNGIVYLDVGMNLRSIPAALLPYASLFGRALVEMGTEREDFVSLSQRIGSETGGIHPSVFTAMTQGREDAVARLFLRGKATVEKASALLDILRDVLLTVRLDDPERFLQMALEEKATQEASLLPMGHAVVGTRLDAHFHEAGWAAEQMGGIGYLFFLRELVGQIENDWPGVLAQLEALRSALINSQDMIWNVTVDEKNWLQIRPQVQALIQALPATESERPSWLHQPLAANEGLTIPAQVNYVGKGADLYELGYQLHGSVHVISAYLALTWLWEQVRMKGGAYGGFCQFDQRSGVFTFLSYRDPNLLGTLDSYDASAAFLRDLELSDDELTKGVIGAIGRLDAYMLPDAKGFTSLIRHLTGLDDALRQRIREEILSTTAADFRAFADVLAQVNEQGHVVTLGSAEAIAAANAQRTDKLTMSKVM